MRRRPARTIHRVGAWQSPARLRRYRYRLGEVVNPHGQGRVLFIGLNPSTASLTRADPTVDVFCRGMAIAGGFREMEVTNLFAYRAKEKLRLLRARDPVGPHGNRFLRQAVTEASIIVAAWGAMFHPMVRARADEVVNLLLNLGVMRVLAIGKNADGSPFHPLYRLIRWDMQECDLRSWGQWAVRPARRAIRVPQASPPMSPPRLDFD